MTVQCDTGIYIYHHNYREEKMHGIKLSFHFTSRGRSFKALHTILRFQIILFYLQHPAKPSLPCPDSRSHTQHWMVLNTEFSLRANTAWMSSTELNSSVFITYPEDDKNASRCVQQVSPQLSSGPSVTEQALWYQYWLQEFLPLFLPFFYSFFHCFARLKLSHGKCL